MSHWGVRAALLLGLIASTASAQSKRYPADPIDKDREAEQKSKLWDNATNPRTKPYEELVEQGRRAISDRTEDAYQLAVTTLGEAIKLQPGEAIAYALRGTAHMELRNWTECAKDLEAAAAKTT